MDSKKTPTQDRVLLNQIKGFGWSRSVLLFSFCANILLLAPALHLLQMYDRVLMSQSYDTLIYITLITLVALFFYAVSEIVRSRIASRISNNFITTHADPLFDRLVHDPRNSLDSNKVLKDLNTVKTFIGGRQYIALHDLPFFPIFLAFMFLLHPTLGFVAVIGIIAMVALAYANYRMTRQARDASTTTSHEANTFSLAVMRRTDDVRAMGLLPSIMQHWGSKTAASLNAADRASTSTAFFFGASKFVRQALQVLVMGWGAFLVLQGDMSGGMMFAASMLLGKTLSPIEQVIGGWQGIVGYKDSCKSIKEATEKATAEDLVELPPPSGDLKVEDLVYQPHKDTQQRPVIRDVSFHLEPGRIMAVVGPSGSGKSTIARLIVGAIAPTSGAIRLDDFEIAQWPQWQAGQAIGYIPQDILLFPGSIASNIARLDPQASDEHIVRAAKMAGVHDMIARLPEGYNTEIGPDKVPLSGGQRQRIALARAYYTDPKLLVLDEPNAHLDAKGEEILMRSLLEARERGVAILIVSQRKSILRIADQVLVVVEGKGIMQQVVKSAAEITNNSNRPKKKLLKTTRPNADKTGNASATRSRNIGVVKTGLRK